MTETEITKLIKDYIANLSISINRIYCAVETKLTIDLIDNNTGETLSSDYIELYDTTRGNKYYD